MGIIRRSFRHLDKKTFCQLFKSMVRPHLEFAAPVWNPYHKKNIKKLESVQRRATKQVAELKNMPYEDRLTELNLPTLAYRRMRGDIIEVFKMMTGKYDNKATKLISSYMHDSGSNTRGHPMKLKKKPCSKNTTKHFFNRRVINTWNALPQSIVEAPSLNAFKNSLDKHWNNLDIKYNFDAAMAKENPFTATGGFGAEFHQYRRR